MNTTSVKIFPFCCEPFIDPFFHIFARTKALLSKCVKSSMRTSGNGKETNRVSKPHGVEFPSRVLPTYSELVLLYVMKKHHFVLPLSIFWPFLKQKTVQIDQLLLVTFSIKSFSRF